MKDKNLPAMGLLFINLNGIYFPAVHLCKKKRTLRPNSTYNYFNQRCWAAFAIRLLGETGNLLINLPNLALAFPSVAQKNKSH